jgi:hypothetical protein
MTSFVPEGVLNGTMLPITHPTHIKSQTLFYLGATKQVRFRREYPTKSQILKSSLTSQVFQNTIAEKTRFDQVQMTNLVQYLYQFQSFAEVKQQ